MGESRRRGPALQKGDLLFVRSFGRCGNGVVMNRVSQQRAERGTIRSLKHSDTPEEAAEKYTSRTRTTFTGLRFVNREPVKKHTAWDLIKWGLSGRRRLWPRMVAGRPGETPPPKAEPGELRYLVVNHATVLIQTDRLNIVTDPIWSRHPGLVSWAGPRRSHPPGITLAQLPAVDLVLLTHNHYDHMDIPTLRRLVRRDNPLLVAGLGNRRVLYRHGLRRVKELDWWESMSLGPVTVSFAPARHFSRRGLWDYNRSLWGGFVVQGSRGPVYFAGDTGYGRFIGDIYRRFGPMALAFIPIGAYRPRWMMGSVHLNPEEAWQMHLALESRYSVGIHFGTFQLADEGIAEPAERIGRLAAEHTSGKGRFIIPRFGKTVTVPENGWAEVA